METGKAKLNGEVHVHFSHQKTVRKNSKVVENENTTFKFGFKVFVGIVLIFTGGVVATYLASNIHRENSDVQTTQELPSRNVTFDSPTYNIGSLTDDKSTNYYQNSAPVTVDKSTNKFNSDINNQQQSIRQSQSVQQVASNVEQQPSKNRQILQPIQNQPSSNYSMPPKLTPVTQNEPRPQGGMIDLELNDYLQTMEELGLQGREAADDESASTTCIAKQNAWYRQTAPFLKQFQGYLRANYDRKYFIFQDSNIEPLTTDIPFTAAQCRKMFSSQASLVVEMSDLIRKQLRNNLPNS